MLKKMQRFLYNMKPSYKASLQQIMIVSFTNDSYYAHVIGKERKTEFYKSIFRDGKSTSDFILF
jgi:hypothetical protein